jgi:hypothetical protein
MKNLIALAVLLMISAATAFADDQPFDAEIRGSLKMIFPVARRDSQTNVYEICLLSKPPYWELSITSSNRQHEVFASPKQTFEVDLFTNTPNGTLNTAFIRIFPGAQPLEDRLAEHVWLALLSKHNFIGQVLPLHITGLGMGEPSIITKVNGGVDDASPRQMQWNNEFPMGRSGRIEGDFEWLASTNTFDGLNIPTVSQMGIYFSDLNGSRKLASLSELIISDVRPLGREPTQIPKIPGRSAVCDYRLADFSKFGWGGNYIQYNVFGSKGLEEVPSNLNLNTKANEKKILPDIYDESADGSKQISDALVTARKEGKHVLLQFGANWCGWCHLLHTVFKTDKDISEELNRNYLLVMIDVNNGHNTNVDKMYGHPIQFGLPVIVILDGNGKQLTTKNTNELEDGRSYNRGKVMAFLKDWAPEKMTMLPSGGFLQFL